MGDFRTTGDSASFFCECLELGGFFEIAMDEECHWKHDQADPERDPPSPGEERISRKSCCQDQEHDIAQHHTDRNTELGEAAEEPAAVRRCVLGGQQYGPAPLCSHGQALADSQRHEDGRGKPHDIGVGDETNQGGCHSHEDHGGNEHRLSAVPVTEMTGEHTTDRTGDESDCDGGKRTHCSDHLAVGGEERRVEHERGGSRVDEEVVPLQGSGDSGCKGRAPRSARALHRRFGVVGHRDSLSVGSFS